MRVHLIDGTYELFRHYFAMPSQTDRDGQEVAAAVGVLSSMLNLLQDGATHMAVATDKVIESFRNDLWPGYKSGEGVEPALLSQFPVLEDALVAMGVVVWDMVEFEADDALAAGAQMAAADERVEEVLICTPDKDLGQCVVDNRVVQFDRRQRKRIDAAGVREKFGVEPESMPDYLGLVGDSADGFPGLKGWGARSASKVLARYGHIENIPDSADEWEVDVRGSARLAATLARQRPLAILFRFIATVDRSAPVSATVDELLWQGPKPGFAEVMERLGTPGLARQATALADRRRK